MTTIMNIFMKNRYKYYFTSKGKQNENLYKTGEKRDLEISDQYQSQVEIRENSMRLNSKYHDEELYCDRS